MTKFLNKKSCFVGKKVKLGKNVTIHPNNFIDGNCYIGDNVVLMPGNYIVDSNIFGGCQIFNSVIEKSELGSNSKVGPFARIRPGSIIGKACKIGNFVEIKNSKIGDGCKIGHLAYVGDSTVGCECNVGCGAIFVNYDGKKKHQITVGDHVFIGSNCNLIAPVTIGDNSYICAATTVTKDTECGDFVIGRVRQENSPKKGKNYY